MVDADALVEAVLPRARAKRFDLPTCSRVDDLTRLLKAALPRGLSCSTGDVTDRTSTASLIRDLPGLRIFQGRGRLAACSHGRPLREVVETDSTAARANRHAHHCHCDTRHGTRSSAQCGWAASVKVVYEAECVILA